MTLPIAGKIERAYQVTCTECGDRTSAPCRNAELFAASLRKAGWSVRAGGWVCAGCAIVHATDMAVAGEGRSIIVPSKAAVRRMVLEKPRHGLDGFFG